MSLPRYDTQNHYPPCLLDSILSDQAGHLALVQGSLLTALGLGWAVYSRIFLFELQSWVSKFGVGQEGPPQNKDLLSDFQPETEASTQLCPQTRLDTTNLPKVCLDSGMPSAAQDTVMCNEQNAMDQLPQLCLPQTEKHKVKTESVLQKHFNYLEPWVSKQPISPGEEIDGSESRVADELRRMSLSSFTDLSKAIYRDVRRREQENSPDSPNPPQTPWETSMRNKEVEARMIMCRTINGQYLRLVLALVLELARRIADIRIGVKRHAVILGT